MSREGLLTIIRQRIAEVRAEIRACILMRTGLPWHRAWEFAYEDE